jgi:hypothetical protein
MQPEVPTSFGVEYATRDPKLGAQGHEGHVILLMHNVVD